MTRFARSKGSKASNERVAEEATPWQQMKQQLLDKKNENINDEKRKEVEAMRLKNYNEFLNENNVESNWAEFPSNEKSGKNSIKKKKKTTDIDTTDEISKPADEVKTSAEVKKAKKKKVSKINEEKTVDTTDLKKSRENSIKKKKTTDIDTTDEINKPADEVKISAEVKKAKKKKVNKTNEEKTVDTTNQQEVIKQKEEQKTKKDLNDLSEQERKKIERKKAKKLKQIEKRNKFKAEKQNETNQDYNNTLSNQSDSYYSNNTLSNDSYQSKNFENNNTQFNKSNNEHQKPKLKRKLSSDEKGEFKRRKPAMDNTIIINGKQIELAYYDGFPVKKEDHERLKKLRKEMISKGLPRSEINIALRLERRKAEKALAREKKKVCFNCRKSGHNLSECPDLNSKSGQFDETTASGICFKCGSTEHTHFECKVVRGQEFKYAKCFVCGEQGHIARQCPDNSRGLYPKGGACKLCGDVTHFKKDCPTLQIEQQDSNCLQTIDENNIESLDIDNKKLKISTNRCHKPNRIVFD